MKVCVQRPCVASCSITSRISLALDSAVHVLLSRTSVARIPPSTVTGHCGFAAIGTPARFVGRWCDGFVLVTSWKPVGALRRPEPWQAGQVVVSPKEFPILRSPPQTPHDSSGRSEFNRAPDLHRPSVAHSATFGDGSANDQFAQPYAFSQRWSGSKAADHALDVMFCQRLPSSNE